METIAFAANLNVIGQRTLEHISIVLVAVSIAVVTAVPSASPSRSPGASPTRYFIWRR